MGFPLIRLEKVSAVREGRRVLSGIDWVVFEGEHWAILGNNGSGKTTLLEVVAGYLWPAGGTVDVLGERFGSVFLPDLRKKIGFVSPWIFERIRDAAAVEAVVASGIEAAAFYPGKISKILRKRIRGFLSLFGCPALARKAFGTLSSGEQLKVMIARALIGRPRILVLDEPFSLFDMGARFHFYALIRKLVQRFKVQVIMVTHHLDDILPFFTHGLILKKGRIFARGPLPKILRPGVLTGAFSLKTGGLEIPSMKRRLP